MLKVNFAVAAMRFCGPVGRFVGSVLNIVTRCSECGATHRARVSLHPGELRDVGTMLHQPWCSVDMRNIRRNVMVVRR